MNKYIVPIVTLLVGLGLGFAIPHGATPAKEPVLGGLYETNTTHLAAGFYAGQTDQLSVDSSGNFVTTGSVNAATYKTATVGYSTSSPAALGSASAGFFTIGTSTPAFQAVSASTTAVTVNSSIFLQQTTKSPVAGITCNATPATSTVITAVVTGSGFVAQAGSIPVTNPNCYFYRILN